MKKITLGIMCPPSPDDTIDLPLYVDVEDFNGEGEMLRFCFTGEGLIIDLFDDAGNSIATQPQMYEELVDELRLDWR